MATGNETKQPTRRKQGVRSGTTQRSIYGGWGKVGKETAGSNPSASPLGNGAPARVDNNPGNVVKSGQFNAAGQPMLGLGDVNASGRGGGLEPMNATGSFTTAYNNAGGGGWMGDTAAGMMAADPSLMLRQMMNSGGLSPTGFGLMEPMADVANALYMISNGNQGYGSNPQFMNYMQDFWQNAMSGNYLNAPALWGQLTNPSGALADLIGGNGVTLDPQTQVQNFSQLATAIAGATLHPLMFKAFQNNLSNQVGNYMLQAARSATAPNLGYFADTFQSPF